MTRRAPTLALTGALLTLALAGQALGANSSEPRAFGYTVGDVVTRRIALRVPTGLRLDEDSLPRAGGRGRAQELQRVAVHRSLTGAPEELQLDYQVFLAPRELRVLEMPAVELRFDGSPQASPAPAARAARERPGSRAGVPPARR